MKQQTNESLSSLMDDDLQNKTFLSEFPADKEAIETWKRYNLIRDCLQNTLPDQIDVDIHRRVMSSLENEPTILAPRKKKPIPFVKPVAGLAIAASVMAAVLVGVQTNQLENIEQQEIVAANQVPSQTTIHQSPESFRAVSNSPNPASTIPESTMNRYLVNYNEFRANRSVQGMVPYVRIVGYEAEQ